MLASRFVITENDVLKGEKAIYHIDRTIKELNHKAFDDKQHIIYINGSFKGEDALGKLIQDFQCKNPKEMNYPILSERAEYLKNQEGENGMCKIMDDLIKKENEKAITENKKEIATKLIKASKMPMTEIALMTDLTLAEVEEIAKELQRK